MINPRGRALSADRLRVHGGLFCETDRHEQRFEAKGELWLRGAHVEQLGMVGAHLSNPNGSALHADLIHVDAGLFCQTDGFGQRFKAEGEVRLRGAHIGARFSLAGAHLVNRAGHALDASLTRVDGDLLSGNDATDDDEPRFRAEGEVGLLGAHVSRTVDFSRAHLTNPQGVALNFERGRAHRLVLPAWLSFDDEVALTDAVVSEFHDNPGAADCVDGGYRARLTGFTYESLGPTGGDCAKRLAWLSRATDDAQRRAVRGGHVPGAYDQLAAVYRRAGQDDEAKRTMIAKHIRRRQSLGPLGKAAGYVLGASFGYGYRTWRAAAAIVVIVLLGWPVFDWTYPKHMTATRAAAQLPPFHGLLYSLDSVLPVVSLGQETARTPLGVAQAWYAFSILAGWVLGLGLVAFLTARFFRE